MEIEEGKVSKGGINTPPTTPPPEPPKGEGGGMNKSTQEAYHKLRETLGFSEEVDLWLMLCTANTRINRLQKESDGTYDPQEAKDKLGLTIGPRSVRKLAIKLLDDENGIDIEAYRILSVLLVETGNENILEQVDMTENRVYIGEDWAEEELNKIENNNASE